MRTNWRIWSARTSRPYRRKLWQTSHTTFEKEFYFVYSLWKPKCLIDSVLFFGSSILFFHKKNYEYDFISFFLNLIFYNLEMFYNVLSSNKLDLVLILLFKQVLFHIGNNQSLHSGYHVSNLVKKFIFSSKLVPGNIVITTINPCNQMVWCG